MPDTACSFIFRDNTITCVMCLPIQTSNYHCSVSQSSLWGLCCFWLYNSICTWNCSSELIEDSSLHTHLRYPHWNHFVSQPRVCPTAMSYTDGCFNSRLRVASTSNKAGQCQLGLDVLNIHGFLAASSKVILDEFVTDSLCLSVLCSAWSCIIHTILQYIYICQNL